MAAIPKQDMEVLMGDFNSNVDSSNVEHVLGKHGLETRFENEHLFGINSSQ
jgi:hypothetical protein